jgi:hypothetical protein
MWNESCYQASVLLQIAQSSLPGKSPRGLGEKAQKPTFQQAQQNQYLIGQNRRFLEACPLYSQLTAILRVQPLGW